MFVYGYLLASASLTVIVVTDLLESKFLRL